MPSPTAALSRLRLRCLSSRLLIVAAQRRLPRRKSFPSVLTSSGIPPQRFLVGRPSNGRKTDARRNGEWHGEWGKSDDLPFEWRRDAYSAWMSNRRDGLGVR
jgi:hypothetical protein